VNQAGAFGGDGETSLFTEPAVADVEVLYLHGGHGVAADPSDFGEVVLEEEGLWGLIEDGLVILDLALHG
jgi:hypothetical protein